MESPFIRTTALVTLAIVILVIAGMRTLYTHGYKQRIGQDEADKSLADFQSAEKKYKETTGRFGTLKELKGSGLIHANMGWDYSFDVNVTETTYSVSAVPVHYGEDGYFSYYLDESGVITGADNKGAPVDQKAVDEQIVLAFFSDADSDTLKAIFGRGERMIPQLMKFRGDQTLMFPLRLGLVDPNSAKLWNLPLDSESVRSGGKSVYDRDADIVTREVVALYLICAIYHGDLRFAAYPLFTDLSLPAEDQRSRNTQELVNKAWVSVENWEKKRMADGLASLQAKHLDPLKGSNVAFW